MRKYRGGGCFSDSICGPRPLDLLHVSETIYPRIPGAIAVCLAEFRIDDHGPPVNSGAKQRIDQLKRARPTHTPVQDIETMDITHSERLGHEMGTARFQESAIHPHVNEQFDILLLAAGICQSVPDSP